LIVPPATSHSAATYTPMLTPAPTFDHLYGLFPDSPDRSEATQVPAAQVPEPYHRLLVHSHHMTVTVERFYQGQVDVEVLACRRVGNEYARKILLRTREGRVVQFGLVRINLAVCPEPVRQEIVEGRTPLGRVLIRHDMLRRIEPVSYLRVVLAPAMAAWFGAAAGTTTYGRLGVIYTGDRPAVEVLEILAPIRPSAPAAGGGTSAPG
jgi:chorismate-pyruvate lyase